MSILQNIAYATLFTGTAFYASSDFNKQDIKDLILEVQAHQGNPYEEVINLTKPEEKITYSPEIGYSRISMHDMKHWRDFEWLAKLLYTERSNPKDDTELRYIAATAIHRALMNGETIKQVCQNKKQYSGVMRNRNKHWVSDPKRIHKQVAYDMLELYKDGIPDEFKQMYFFCNMETVRKTNKKAYKWFVKLRKIATCEHHGQTHTFFTCDKWDRYVSNNPDAKLTDKHLQ